MNERIEMKDIEGFEGMYAVTSNGEVYSYKSGKYLKNKLDRYNYYQVGLYDKDRKQHWILVSRLVAKAFIPNPDNLPDVSHKDECSTHNWVSNLEWATRKDNCNMPLHKQRISEKLTEKLGRAIECIETGKVYKTIAEAARETGIHYSTLAHCLTRRNNTAGGFHWQYVS